MRKLISIVAVVAASAALSGGAAFATPEPPEHKVAICHRTGSATNPYVIITVDVAAWDGDGKSDHRSHVQVGNGTGGDVEAFLGVDGEYFCPIPG